MCNISDKARYYLQDLVAVDEGEHAPNARVVAELEAVGRHKVFLEYYNQSPVSACPGCGAIFHEIRFTVSERLHRDDCPYLVWIEINDN